MGFKVKKKEILINRECSFIYYFCLNKENTGEAFPKDKEGNRLFSDVHFTETYQVENDLLH